MPAQLIAHKEQWNFLLGILLTDDKDNTYLLGIRIKTHTHVTSKPYTEDAFTPQIALVFNEIKFPSVPTPRYLLERSKAPHNLFPKILQSLNPTPKGITPLTYHWPIPHFEQNKKSIGNDNFDRACAILTSCVEKLASQHRLLSILQ